MNEMLMIKDKEIAVPGEILATGMGFIPNKGVFRDGELLVANKLGMVSVEGKVIKLIPLSGKYIPKIDDKIICQITDILLTGWRVDTNSPYSAVLNLKDATNEFVARGSDLTQYFALDDWVVCKVTNVTSQKLVDISTRGPGLHKLQGGRMIEVNSYKVPRIIGKDASMISLIKNATGCEIIVGQNGLVWLHGTPDNELIAVEAIKKIEVEAHLPGLTDRIIDFLKQKTGKTPVAQQSMESES
ncbi:MAG: exosome complex RNA-binding protein Rrp4 [Candidatus Woesearchaeota archaeon]|nr:exosome complex RNA-binding protein Rrp4 [Candidatus Woesearchaeota archaeon]